MKQHWRQLIGFCSPVLILLWLVAACQSRPSSPAALAQDIPDPARREVGANTGTIQAVAYSGDNGDAYVRIEGGVVYAEARLNGSIVDPTPTTTPTTLLPPATPIPYIVNTPAPDPILAPTEAPTDAAAMITVNSSANVRAAPWGAILGAVGQGESFTPNAQALPWYRFVWNGQEAWIHGDLVTVAGNTATLPVVSISVAQPAPAAAQPVAEVPAPTQAPSEPAAAAEPSYQFLASFPTLQSEANNPAFYIQIDQNGNPAPGRWCVVFHDGEEVGRAQSLNVLDTANKGTPWDGDDRDYNCEVKFFAHNPQSWPGTWVVEVQDGAGTVIGRSQPFTLTQTEQQAWIFFLGT